MRIALYGMPTSGKSFILDKIDFISVMQGSKMLRDICPDFDYQDETGKKKARQQLADVLAASDNFIMDGHYAFGDEIAFTDNDGSLYDVFLYLYVSPEALKKRMEESVRNRKYLSYNIGTWQEKEIEGLREYCHEHDKDFYIIDNPPQNEFNDASEVISFIQAIINGFSCKTLAEKCSNDILSKSKTNTVTLMDGDKTITAEDSSNAVFGYTTHLYDGNFYTGYQSWRQAEEFEQYSFDDLKEMPVSLNDKVCKAITGDTYILTSGHERVWTFIAGQLNIPFYYGIEMSAETKYFITKRLQKAGKKVVAYGDGMNDYYMLKQADEGFLVTKKDGSISRSLKNKNLEGLNLVRIS